MRKLILSLVMLLVVGKGQVFAQGRQLVASPSPTALIATESAVIATPSAVPVIETRSDLTEPNGEVKGRLERYIDEQELGQLGLTNFVKYSIRGAVKGGVPANTLVLVLLFPVIAALVAAARHLIGLRGFGIYIPAVLSVAFVATGIVEGIVLFMIILNLGTYGMKLIRKLKMQYLPRMALMLWLISIGVLAALFGAAYIGIGQFATLNIFPILILMLLAENFHEVQMGKSQREATELTIETLVLAVVAALLISLETVQRFALLHPELLIMGVAVVNIFVGKYVGLRLNEYLKFRKLTE